MVGHEAVQPSWVRAEKCGECGAAYQPERTMDTEGNLLEYPFELGSVVNEEKSYKKWIVRYACPTQECDVLGIVYDEAEQPDFDRYNERKDNPAFWELRVR